MDAGAITQQGAVEFRDRLVALRYSFNRLLNCQDDRAQECVAEFVNHLDSLEGSLTHSNLPTTTTRATDVPVH